ncbi:MAG: septum formation initiator family protein [Candidatus Omnitrophica bacterium]|nr:septum formation initiator family protein [Candidatus Omnitrophota bacterium]MBU1128027.1 septum formation initiator family protein [Candidatus Omnitrophota bacterium]MBU1657233.1 septum formation initiator family protein [Candidatus Omnitrophota bacterium]MBU1784525.1 septum formation initiator family protein [Candidatus Omnitrophota bacterium]MBU1851123.1 septum formation initiator family protein [Candidatus Omnitrophota bacterium]
MARKKIIFWAIVVIIMLGVVFLPRFSELQRLREENANIKKSIILLRQDNEALTEEVRRMEQDPWYVEKKAREKLGIIKKGEYIYKKSGD